MTDAEKILKNIIFEMHPDLQNVIPIGWRFWDGITAKSDAIVIAVVDRHRYDGWNMLPVRDIEILYIARKLLPVIHRDRMCSMDDTAVLVLMPLQ